MKANFDKVISRKKDEEEESSDELIMVMFPKATWDVVEELALSLETTTAHVISEGIALMIKKNNEG